MSRTTGPNESTVMLVWERDRGRCARCGASIRGERGQSWSVHHRVPRGSGGAKHVPWMNLAANLLLLCGSGTTGCHGWIEAHRSEAISKGWLMLRNSYLIPEDVEVHHAIHGVVLLNDQGAAVPAALVSAREQS